MKKLIIFFYLTTISAVSQEIVVDSMKIENLEEVLVSSVRVKNNMPIAYNNISKEEISNRNLGQDLPILQS